MTTHEWNKSHVLILFIQMAQIVYECVTPSNVLFHCVIAVSVVTDGHGEKMPTGSSNMSSDLQRRQSTCKPKDPSQWEGEVGHFNFFSLEWGGNCCQWVHVSPDKPL